MRSCDVIREQRYCHYCINFYNEFLNELPNGKQYRITSHGILVKKDDSYNRRTKPNSQVSQQRSLVPVVQPQQLKPQVCQMTPQPIMATAVQVANNTLQRAPQPNTQLQPNAPSYVPVNRFSHGPIHNYQSHHTGFTPSQNSQQQLPTTGILRNTSPTLDPQLQQQHSIQQSQNTDVLYTQQRQNPLEYNGSTSPILGPRSQQGFPSSNC